jgi:hypothetical protein
MYLKLGIRPCFITLNRIKIVTKIDKISGIQVTNLGRNFIVSYKKSTKKRTAKKKKNKILVLFNIGLFTIRIFETIIYIIFCYLGEKTMLKNF